MAFILLPSGEKIATTERNGEHFQRVSTLFEDPRYRYLDTNGNGTGTKNANGNYAGGATQFFVAPAAGEIFHCTRMIVSLRDAGTLDTGSYGNGITLTNGIKVEVRQGATTTILDLIDGIPIKTNMDWSRQCYDVRRDNWGTGDEYLSARWTFEEAGAGIHLVGDNSDRLTVILEDNFTGLVEHYFQVQLASV